MNWFAALGIRISMASLAMLAMSVELVAMPASDLNYDCAWALGNSLAGNPSPPCLIVQGPGVHRAWKWDYVNQTWVLGTFKAHATGVNSGVCLITHYPDAFNGKGADGCSPAYLAELTKVLIHELLHFQCEAHSVPPQPVGDPDVPGENPDCGDLNYAINTAKGVCDRIGEVMECLQNPECAGLEDSSGALIPGLERANLATHCESLSDQHSEMQAAWNHPVNATTAFYCMCVIEWEDAGSQCPNALAAPPGGCPPSATPSSLFPDDKVIPDCSHGCQ